RAVEAVGCPRIRVCRDVKAVPVRADVRVVAQARARIDAAGVCAVIRDIHAIDVPQTCWVSGPAYRDVEVVDGREATGRKRFQGEHDEEETLRLSIIQAAWIGHLRTA